MHESICVRTEPKITVESVADPLTHDIRGLHLFQGVSVNGETWIDSDGDGDCDPGEGIEYVIFVLNEGTVTLKNPQLSDDLLGVSLDCGDASEGGSLAPNEGMTCTGTYQVRINSFLSLRFQRGDYTNEGIKKCPVL